MGKKKKGQQRKISKWCFSSWNLCKIEYHAHKLNDQDKAYSVNINLFTCNKGTSSIGSSAPRSPRATIAYKVEKVNIKLKK